MTNPLIVFRVGYMSSYKGVGDITGGGSYVEENGNGGEMWNFRSEGGRCYGYVMTKGFVGVDLHRIAPDQDWSDNDELSGVDIVFIAKRPEVGQVVVGWYRNATVFHRSYHKRRGRKRTGDWEGLDYLCEVDADNALLLPEALRTFRVPQGVKGFPGQSNVWYADTDTPDVKLLIAELRKLVSESDLDPVGSNSTKSGGGWSAPDGDLITKIEQSAVAAARSYWMNQGYKVKSVETDNRGWDLEARKSRELLLVEVKGHIGNAIQFELTPNEYFHLKEHASSYRVCVLRNVLVEIEVEVYAPKMSNGKWLLERIGKAGQIQFSEKTAARAFEVSID